MAAFQKLNSLNRSKMKLSELCEEFTKAKPDLTVKYLKDTKRAFELFEGVVGNIPVASVEKKHIIRFRAEMLQRRKKIKTGRELQLVVTELIIIM